MAQHPFDNGALEVRDEQLEPVPRTRKTLREHTADYYGMISHIDEQLGVVIDALKARGELENTIIIYTADHGIGLGRHGLLGKQNLYDHSMHVPLLISGPGIPSGETRSARCYLLDLYPTICDMLNLSAPPSVEGQSLQSVISSQTDRHRDQLFFAYGDMQRAVCDGRYKLIDYRVAGTRRSQLFDVSHDPYELCDLSSHPACADTLARLQQALKEAMQNAGDTSSSFEMV
jgi:arylsulfatase A-like enzyme